MDTVQWLFLDLNSYFASVEQQLNPSLRNKPVAVVPLMADTTFCIAASYEAKKFGVKTGVRVGDAKKMCPKLILVEAQHEKYVQYHNTIVEAVESCIPISAVMSIDEVACELMGSEQKVEKAIQLAKKIKNTIYEKAGEHLKCSVGLATNRFLAKVATDMQKPDGLVVLLKKDLPHALYKLKPIDLAGIGPRMNRRLELHNIKTLEKLCSLDMHEMRKIWGGIHGERFWYWLRGEEALGPKTQTSSVSQSHVLAPELRNPEKAYAVIQKLLHKAAARIRKMGYWTRGLSVFVKHQNDTEWSHKTTLIECQDTLTLVEGLQSLWKKYPGGKPFAVGLALYDLIPDELHNFSLFDEGKRTQLSKAMDRLNNKFGKHTVFFGGMSSVEASAPTRIAFTSIPDFDT